MTRRYRFSASHRLHSPLLTNRQNQAVYGKCNHPFGHGHDYVLDVQVTAEVDATTGLLLPLPVLDSFIGKHVLQPFSHRDLNRDIPDFEHIVPTTENLALVIANRLLENWTRDITYRSAQLSGITIEETASNRIEVMIPQHLRTIAQLSEMKESLTVHG